VTASRTAREKLRIDVMEMSVLATFARHILMAFKRTGRKAALADASDGRRRVNRESTESPESLSNDSKSKDILVG